jgi:predicted thioesterase
LAAVVDEAMGSLHWMLRVPAVTARLEVDYLAPVPVGSRMVVRARITGQDGRKVYTAAVVGIDGVPVLRASGLFVQVPSSHFRGYDAAMDADLDRLELNP